MNRAASIWTSLLAVALLSQAQGSNQVTINDQSEFNAYAMASSKNDPAAKAAALESFLETYPEGVNKKAALNILMNTYRSLNDDRNALSAGRRLLEADPDNMQAVFLSVVIKRGQCLKTSDAQTCDDAAALAQSGLALPKPAGLADADFKKVTDQTYPMYHSAIALDDGVSKKDDKAAIVEYKTELMLYTQDQTKSGPGLVDTLQLAEAYAKEDARDMVLACWFYARAWNFAPPAYKAQIEPKLEYWYKRYYGNLDGIDKVKSASAAALFPPGILENETAISPAATPPPAPAQHQYGDLAPPPPPPAPAPTISMGQTKAQVIAAFGEPQRKAAAGTKDIFFYTDLKMKVSFTNGKVSGIE